MNHSAARLLSGLKQALKRSGDGLYRYRTTPHCLLRMPRRKQIVICGYPRAGTSLLYNMMSASLTDFSFGKNETLAAEKVRGYENFVSKRPMDVFHVEYLPRRKSLNKDLFVIVLIRDLRDVITSIHPRVPQDYFIGYDASYRVGGEPPRSSNLTHPGVRAYYEKIDQIDHASGLSVIRIAYEDLVMHPDVVQDRLSSALGVTFSGRFSEFHQRQDLHAYRYAGKQRAMDCSLVRENDEVDTSRIGKWRNPEHRERIRAQFRAHPELFQMLRTYGYEADDRWFDGLVKDACSNE